MNASTSTVLPKVAICKVTRMKPYAHAPSAMEARAAGIRNLLLVLVPHLGVILWKNCATMG
eukprot:3041126-Amphidinium_carterae.2